MTATTKAPRAQQRYLVLELRSPSSATDGRRPRPARWPCVKIVRPLPPSTSPQVRPPSRVSR